MLLPLCHRLDVLLVLCLLVWLLLWMLRVRRLRVERVCRRLAM
jgi:hypothetical protein